MFIVWEISKGKNILAFENQFLDRFQKRLAMGSILEFQRKIQ